MQVERKWVHKKCKLEHFSYWNTSWKSDNFDVEQCRSIWGWFYVTQGWITKQVKRAPDPQGLPSPTFHALVSAGQSPQANLRPGDSQQVNQAMMLLYHTTKIWTQSPHAHLAGSGCILVTTAQWEDQNLRILLSLDLILKPNRRCSQLFGESSTALWLLN